MNSLHVRQAEWSGHLAVDDPNIALDVTALFDFKVGIRDITGGYPG
jgi:hypothetical protein